MSIPIACSEECSAHFVNENDARYDFCNALVDITLHNAIDLSSQFFSDFCPLRFDEMGHDTHNILSALRTRIGSIKIPKCDVLD